jgi:hypothetical protein
MTLHTTLENQTTGNTQAALDAANPLNIVTNGLSNIFGGLSSTISLFGPAFCGLCCCLCCSIILLVLMKNK